MRSLIIFILLLFICGCRSGEIPGDLQKTLDSIEVKWIPDHREALCKINLSRLADGSFVIKGETDLPGLKEELIKTLRNRSVSFYDSIRLIPDPSVIKKPWGLISVSVCNIKVTPSHSGEMASQAIMGTPVKILKKSGGWILIQTPDYYIGWTNDSGVEELSEGEIDSWKSADRLIYLSKSGDLISDKGTGEVVSDIVSGVIIVKTGETGTFYRIILPDGRRALVSKSDVADFNKWSSEIRPDPEKMISFAKTMLGYPYMWGGTSTKATDCSGYTKTIYFTAGIILARDASLQYLYGCPVDISATTDLLRAGDLLYFGHKNAKGDIRITHTGMYIGDTEVIHSSGKVGINSLDSTRTNYSSYLRKTLMGARRIIGFPDGRGTQRVITHPWYFKK